MPSFKSNLDIHQNQLLNAVLHNLPDLPQSPVEGQLYYHSGTFTAYLWNGSQWIPWGEGSSGQSPQIQQFSFVLQNPKSRSGAVLLRLFQPLTILRIDSVINAGIEASFNIEYRSIVEVPGVNITTAEILAVERGTETTNFFLSELSPGYWLYVAICDVYLTGGSIGVVKGLLEGAPEGAVTADALTITITCITN